MLGLEAATSPTIAHVGPQAGRCCCVWWAASCLRASTLEMTWAGEGLVRSALCWEVAWMLQGCTLAHTMWYVTKPTCLHC
jgi:hypothetical protein